MRVIAFDPGKNNFAYAVIADKRCLYHGHVRTITSMSDKELPDQMVQFYQDVSGVLNRAGENDCITFERMQHRPSFGGGAVVEYINVMIGVVIGLAYRRSLRVYPVAPVTWKTHFIRQLDLDRKRFTMVGQKLALKQPPGSPTKTKREFCPGVLDGQAGAAGLTPHEGDAVGIGCYCWEQLTGIRIVASVLA